MRVALSLLAAALSLGISSASGLKQSSGALSRRSLPAFPSSTVEGHDACVRLSQDLVKTSLTKAIVHRGGGSANNGMLQTVKVVSLFGLWYALNVIYNIGRFFLWERL
jgi:hypothetical protein